MHVLVVRLAATAATLALAAPAQAQGGSPPPAPPTCNAPEHRQFDFWVGEWTVRGQTGAVVGTNRIESTLSGCAIVEHWTSSGANRGTSLNFYDRVTGTWRQTWIDNAGQPLHLEGELRDGKMVLEGTTPGAAGAPASRHRITWTPLEGGDVRQLWETSTDGGTTWAVGFDGRYSRTESK